MIKLMFVWMLRACLEHPACESDISPIDITSYL